MSHTPVSLGSVSSGTLVASEVISRIAPILSRLAAEHDRTDHKVLSGFALDCVRLEADEHTLDNLLNEVVDALSEYAPDYAYFGSHQYDGADFGFWLVEDFQQQFCDDGGLEVADLSDVPEDYAGMIMVVNDHGNATLYARDVAGQMRTIWSVV